MKQKSTKALSISKKAATLGKLGGRPSKETAKHQGKQ